MKLQHFLFTLRWGAALGIAGFGFWTFDTESIKWAVLGSCLYFTPLLAQFSNRPGVQVTAIWLGIASVVQTWAPVAFRSDLVTNVPNFNYQYGGGMPGIPGPQSFSTDEKGFRITKPIRYERKTGPRIVTIGGSTTEGSFLGDRNTWSHLLQERLDAATGLNVEVINAGISARSSVHHLATFKEILKYDPDVVIFLLGINDWVEHMREEIGSRRSKVYRNLYFLKYSPLAWVLSKGKLTFKETRVAGEIISQSPSPSSTPGSADPFFNERNALRRRSRVVEFRPTAIRKKYQQALNEMDTLCRSHRLTCVFLDQPTGYQPEASEEFKKSFWITPSLEDYTVDFDSLVYIAKFYNDALARFAREKRHVFCGLAKDFPPTSEYFVDECHHNVKGSHKMATLIENCLADAGVISALRRGQVKGRPWPQDEDA